ncbi:unnamed protein product [Strongylus vulgaris]|uniref:Uncharacterized protein n=1 Tax=Strongylus vulgaris TaxID=40348 RepID=A0A3P7L8Q6_STRVU|nr:unnamed protein product [Strongylus vulgaris]
MSSSVTTIPSTHTTFVPSTITLPSTTTRPSHCCPTTGLWSEWATSQNCSDTCGSCAQLVYRRKCLTESDGCPCSGDDVKIENCNIGVCYYPRDSCCSPYVSTVINGRHACGPQPNITEPPTDTSCCPTNGFWADWGEWSGCIGAGCFKCGTATRTRSCASDSYGCSCIGDSKETQSCVVMATWSEWTVVMSCNTTSCGSCDYERRIRKCNGENGCICTGSDEMTTICNTAPCTKSNNTCCSGFSLMDQNGLKICGPLGTVPAIPELPKCENGSCCVIGGVWSEWSSGNTCSDTCEDLAQRAQNVHQHHAYILVHRVVEIVRKYYLRKKPSSARKWMTTVRLHRISAGRVVRPLEATGQNGQKEGPVEIHAVPAPRLHSSVPALQKLRDAHAGPSSRQKNCNIGVCYYPRDSCCSPYTSTMMGGILDYSQTIRHRWFLTIPTAIIHVVRKMEYGQNGLKLQTNAQITAVHAETLQKREHAYQRLTAVHATGLVQLRLRATLKFAITQGCHVVQALNQPLSTENTPVDHSLLPPQIRRTLTLVESTVAQRKVAYQYIILPSIFEGGRRLIPEPSRRRSASDAVQNQVCGTSVCLFPRSSCCPGFTKKVDTATKSFYCGPLPAEPVFNPEQTTCCDPEKMGLWNQWTEWSKCTSDCGLCGTQTRNRTCASQPYGCPCTGTTTETKKCGQAACTTGQACCTGYPAVGYDGAEFCQPNPPIQCPGAWTEWKTEAGATCNDTCGMCGVIASYRYCWPSGCQCTGAFKSNQPCAPAVCTYPRSTCCAPYVKKIVDKQFVCG